MLAFLDRRRDEMRGNGAVDGQNAVRSPQCGAGSYPRGFAGRRQQALTVRESPASEPSAPPSRQLT